MSPQSEPQRCDFCMSPAVEWSFDAEDVEAVKGAISVGEWLACDECCSLIVNRDWDSLNERGLLNPLAQIIVAARGKKEALKSVKRIHGAFQRAKRSGGPTPLRERPQS